MLCLSPFSEDKPHARFFFSQCSVHPGLSIRCTRAKPQTVPPQIPCAPPAPAAFLPFSAQAFDQARLRDVPVLLFICDAPPSFADAALNMQIFERTVPVWLYPGMRPDVELLCQRAGALFSGEGALPLCALMLEDARVFLAAPLLRLATRPEQFPQVRPRRRFHA